MFCSCCSCVQVLGLWFGQPTPPLNFFFFLMHHHMLLFLLYFDPNCAVNLKMKTLFNALKLDYLNSAELSTEICVDTSLKRTFPLSTGHISCISKPPPFVESIIVKFTSSVINQLQRLDIDKLSLNCNNPIVSAEICIIWLSNTMCMA